MSLRNWWHMRTCRSCQIVDRDAESAVAFGLRHQEADRRGLTVAFMQEAVGDIGYGQGCRRAVGRGLKWLQFFEGRGPVP